MEDVPAFRGTKPLHAVSHDVDVGKRTRNKNKKPKKEVTKHKREFKQHVKRRSNIQPYIDTQGQHWTTHTLPVTTKQIMSKRSNAAARMPQEVKEVVQEPSTCQHTTVLTTPPPHPPANPPSLPEQDKQVRLLNDPNPGHFSLIRAYHLADCITLLNGFCGFTSILSSMRYCLGPPTATTDLYIALAFMPLGLFFDFFDGKVARWRGKSSLMGQELDSLADLVGALLL